MDIGNAEAPVVEKATRLNEAIYGLVGSITSDNLIRVHKPKVSFSEFKLNEAQKRSISFLKDTSSAKEMINIVLNNPPPVFVDQAHFDHGHIDKELNEEIEFMRKQGATDPELRKLGYKIPDMSVEEVTFIKPGKRFMVLDPSPRDLVLSETITSVPEDLDETTKHYLELLVKNCKLYMATPRVRDGFGFTKEEHDKRRLWEEGVMDVFYIIDKEWGDAFKNTVDNNRYSKNRRTTLVSYPSYFRDLPLPENIRKKIEDMEKRFAVAQEMATSGKADIAANILSAESSSLIRFFAKK
jgi:hypothetical protein